MENIWTASYPEGVPSHINPDTYSSLVALFDESVRQHASRVAFSNFGHCLTFKDIDTLSMQWAAFLQHQWQLKKGDKLAIMLPNCLQYPVVLYGALRAGLTVININPLYTAKELEHVLNDSQADGIVVMANFAHIFEAARPNTHVTHCCITNMGDMLGLKGRLFDFVLKYVKKQIPPYGLYSADTFKVALQKGRQRTFQKVIVRNDDLAFLQYTGGTTGVSKGAMLTHRNIQSNVLQARAWLSVMSEEATKGTGIITALPLYHIFSLTANCLTFFMLGVENILITNPRDMKGFIKELNRRPFCAMTGVNTLFNALMNQPKFSTINFSKLQVCLGGGMALQESVAKRWEKLTGRPLIEAYGLTEASPAVCINPINLQGFNGAIGLPVPSTIVSIRDEQERPVPLGDIGELTVYGPQVMKGYWNRPDETEKVFTHDGYLKTGDMAVMDDRGYIRIVDRMKDMIVVSGFNVYPNEVEGVISEIPAVSEVAVVSAPSSKTGEQVVAYLVLKHGATLTEQAVVKHCRQVMTSYKIPKRIIFKTELPKTNVGKVLRRALREEAAMLSAPGQ